jgi:hypothetical protein
MTIGLGVLGSLLLPARQDFAPNILAKVGGPPILAWLAALFAAVWIVYR